MGYPAGGRYGTAGGTYGAAGGTYGGAGGTYGLAGGTYDVVGGASAAVGRSSLAAFEPCGSAGQSSPGYWAGHCDSLSANGASRRRDPGCLVPPEKRDPFSLGERLVNRHIHPEPAARPDERIEAIQSHRVAWLACLASCPTVSPSPRRGRCPTARAPGSASGRSASTSTCRSAPPAAATATSTPTPPPNSAPGPAWCHPVAIPTW